jgi:hypothetical protein
LIGISGGFRCGSHGLEIIGSGYHIRKM